MVSQIISSFKYAIQGILSLFRSERNAKVHLVATIAVIGVGFYLRLDLTEWVLIVFAIGIVLVAEGFNTAIERVTDLLSPEIQPKAGQAKDIAAGAVLLSAICAGVIGLLVLGPKILAMISQ